ncbi:MAG: M55 family metallopeptidase [Fimbriimonas sp.]
MRVYISADIEGITGLVSWSQCGRPKSQYYDYGFAREMMTHDVNAAIRGALQAGATEVVVKDSHGNSKNLLIGDLEPGTQLISGHGSAAIDGVADGMMMGIDSTFDAAILVGYHAMAGTSRGIMEHTITGGVHRLWINGRLTGEMGLSAGVAGHYGVPLAAVSSDQAGCEEIAALIPGISSATVKFGYGRFMGRLLHPSETGPLIENAVFFGLTSIPAPVRFSEPVTLRVEFNRAEEADQILKLAPVHRIDAYTVEGTFATYPEAHQVCWLLMSLSGTGIDAQD